MRIRVYTFMHKGVRQYVSRRPVGISARADILDVYYIKGCYLRRMPKDFKITSLRLDTQFYDGRSKPLPIIMVSTGR
jgi:hypothetical protein